MTESLIPDPQIPGFDWTADMGEISGFGQMPATMPGACTGATYERQCRAMVSAGCAWIAEHPTADLKFERWSNVVGLITPISADAVALTNVMALASETTRGGAAPTGHMMQAGVEHVMTCRALGSWPAYQRRMRGAK